MARLITGTNHTPSPYKFPPGNTYALKFHTNGQFDILLSPNVTTNVTFDAQYPGSYYYPCYGIAQPNYSVTNLQMGNAQYGQYIFYSSNNTIWYVGHATDYTAASYRTDSSKIKSDKLTGLLWTTAFGNTTQSDRITINNIIQASPVIWHQTYGNYCPLKILSSSTFGFSWVDSLVEYIANLELITFMGYIVVPGDNSYYVYEPATLNNSNRPKQMIQVAPCHDGSNCYVLAGIQRFSQFPSPPSFPSLLSRHLWVFKTDVNGNHTGNLAFTAGIDFGGDFQAYMFQAETDPSDPDKIYCISNTGYLYVISWSAGTITLLPSLVLSDYNSSLTIAKDNSLVVSHYDYLTNTFIIYRSTDKGASWVTTNLTSQMPFAPGTVLADIQFDGTIIISFGSRFYFSQDNGVTWSFSADIETGDIYDMASY